MVINNFRKDITDIRETEYLTTTKIAKRMGIDRHDIRKIAQYEVFPKRFVGLLEAMGYDIEVIYHRRDDADSWGDEND